MSAPVEPAKPEPLGTRASLTVMIAVAIAAAGVVFALSYLSGISRNTIEEVVIVSICIWIALHAALTIVGRHRSRP